MKKQKQIFIVFLILILIQGLLSAQSVGNLGLIELQSSTRILAQKVLPTVVTIDTRSKVEVPVRDFGFFFNPFGFGNGNEDGNQNKSNPPTREYNQEGLGSGIIVKRDKSTYYILTNAHVVADADEIDIVTRDEDQFDAELVGVDKSRDLALISVKSPDKELPLAELGNSDSLQQGDIVFAVGNPYGFRSSITFGIISALNRDASPQGINTRTDYIQTDAAVNKGNSGGPLVNISGQVIGINTWIFSSGGGGYEGLSFAVPINNAKHAIDEFIQKGSVDYGFLGVQVDKVYEDDMTSLGVSQGALILGLHLDSPADKAGVEVGDVVIGVDNTKIKTDRELVNYISGLAPGKKVDLKIIRSEKEITIPVTLSKRDDEKLNKSSKVWPGFAVVDISNNLKKRLDLATSTGVVVTYVVKGTSAEIGGIKVGDVIERINGNKIKNMSEFFEELKKVENDEDVSLRVNRQGAALVFGIVKK